MTTHKTDLAECSSPDDVALVLRAAADLYYESQGELQSAWGDKQAGRGWSVIARELEKLAAKLERTGLV